MEPNGSFKNCSLVKEMVLRNGIGKIYILKSVCITNIAPFNQLPYKLP